MKLLENKWFWIVAFGTLFVLSIDLWAWDWTEPSVFGLPYTIVYIIALEVALFVMFVLFNRFYWKDQKEES
jgi:putative flippase GtrA